MTVKKRGVKSILGEAAMLGVCIIFFIPFYYLLVNTFKPAREATVSPLSLPVKSFTLDLYRQALDTINFWSSFRNSILITVVSVVIIISIGSMASYAISRRKNKLTQFLFFYFLIGFMVPVQTTLIPLFNLMSFLKLQNSVAGMIVLYSSWCNFAMFMYQGFSNDLMMLMGNLMQWKFRMPSIFKKALYGMTQKTVHDVCTKTVWKADDVHKTAATVRQYKERLGYSEQWMTDYVYNIVLLAKKEPKRKNDDTETKK